MYMQRVDILPEMGVRRIELDMNPDGLWITIRKWGCKLDEWEDVKLTREEAFQFAETIIKLASQITK